MAEHEKGSPRAPVFPIGRMNIDPEYSAVFEK
jgi:hypothetical protein